MILKRPDKLRRDQIMGPHETLLRRNRIFFLYGQIYGLPDRSDEFSPTYVMDGMLALDSLSHEPIKLVVDTFGGQVAAGLNLYDVMKTVSSPIYTIGRSCVSMGAIISAAGEMGHRYLFENARVMIHLPLGQVQGDAKEVEIQAKEMEKTKNILVEILRANGVKKTAEEILKDIDREYWMTPQEAIDYGLADKILTRDLWGGLLNKSK